MTRKQIKAAEAALVTFLNDRWKIPEDSTAYVYSSNDPGDGYRVHELGTVKRDGSGGATSFRNQEDPETGALILACEDFVRTFGIKPYRPEGWESDMDEHGDVVWRLEKLAVA